MSAAIKRHLAIDIGASSGRHIAGRIENGKITLEEVYRFDNSQVVRNGHECWDLAQLTRHILAGLKAAGEKGFIPETVGIDTWGVDFVLVNELGLPVSDAVAYRDSRTDGMPEALDEIVPFERLYAATGIQRVKFNTVYQLLALKRENPEQLEKAHRLLMIPDYLNFVLTGKMLNEYTIASTSALVNAEKKTWDDELIAAIGLPRRIFGELSIPGTEAGAFTSAVASAVGYSAKVLLPATHDTASAYLAVPAEDDLSVYISSGTWSLIGVELPKPITSTAAQAANYTNEGGAWGRYRFLKNSMGLWIIQSIRRELMNVNYVDGKASQASAAALSQITDYRPGGDYSYAALEAAARRADDDAAIFDVNDQRFFNPDSMITEVISAAAAAGAKVDTVGALVKCVYRSLAANYAKEVKNLCGITGRDFKSVNIVGGGSQSAYLNELTAESTGMKVTAGPVEGTVIGNLIVQMIASGEFADLGEARRAIVR